MHVSRFLALAVAVLFSACARPLPKYEKPIARTQLQRVRTTAYTHTESDHRQHGCLTCLGTQLRYGAVRSAAADWSRWPAGTLFRIQETGEICEVDDIGWALSGRNTIDLYKPSRAAMNAWGVRMVNIEILRWGDDRESLALLQKRSKHRHVKRMLDGLENRVARGETNPEPAIASVPAVAPSTVAVSTSVPTPTTTPAAPLRPFRQPVQ
jgi:3D (Asp-Asp-Asp) domain-containing protein